MASNNNWKGRVLLIGGLAGAMTGLAAAYLLVRRAEQQGVEPRLEAGEGIRLGLLLLGLLRQVSVLTEPEK
ncbi:MAG TPA: hypothetical protein VFI11_07330 [Anaerolineales bacterium]|nr:hypothetical protein [Anaerolineales bacterium]